MADLQQEMFEDLFQRRDEIRDEIDESGDKDGRLLAQLNEINEALDEKAEVQDDLFDFWDSELEAGRIPNLDMMPGDLHAED
jgi:uncharacterized coiled-coil DUF342 family protein